MYKAQLESNGNFIAPTEALLHLETFPLKERYAGFTDRQSIGSLAAQALFASQLDNGSQVEVLMEFYSNRIIDILGTYFFCKIPFPNTAYNVTFGFSHAAHPRPI